MLRSVHLYLFEEKASRRETYRLSKLSYSPYCLPTKRRACVLTAVGNAHSRVAEAHFDQGSYLEAAYSLGRKTGALAPIAESFKKHRGHLYG